MKKDEYDSDQILSILKKIRGIFFNGKDNKKDYEFYNYNLNHRKYMLILQNPGSIETTVEKDIKNASNGKEVIEVYRCGVKKWIEVTNKCFWKEFKNALTIIDKNFKDAKKGNLLTDFYITDVFKKRDPTSKIDELDEAKKQKSYDLLKEEIDKVKPDLIFVFGCRAWDSIKKIYNDKLEKIEDCEKEVVTKCHGYLFKIKNGSYIIPLAHFSGRNQFLRESYFDYLKKGLKKIKKERSNKTRKGL